MMGCITSNAASESNETSRKIDEKIKNDMAQLQYQVKLLLIGAGESGKSTILKQLKIIHEHGYTDEEKEEFRYVIWGNIVYGMQAILDQCLEKNTFPEKMKTILKDFSKAVDSYSDSLMLGSEMGGIISEMWQSPIIKDAYDKRAGNRIHVSNGIAFFFDNIATIAVPDYLPTHHEIMLARSKTTGVVERSFTYKKIHFQIVDMGGQRSERKKWIYCFEDVTCLIFCVATSEYDEMLSEDDSVNRMNESLMLFESIANSQYFKKTSIILFLNKIDLFKEKIKTVPLNTTFPDYKGDDNNWEQAISYIESKFISLCHHDKTIYVKQTCATNTDNIRFIFDAVTDIIVSRHINSCYF